MRVLAFLVALITWPIVTAVSRLILAIGLGVLHIGTPAFPRQQTRFWDADLLEAFSMALTQFLVAIAATGIFIVFRQAFTPWLALPYSIFCLLWARLSQRQIAPVAAAMHALQTGEDGADMTGDREAARRAGLHVFWSKVIGSAIGLAAGISLGLSLDAR